MTAPTMPVAADPAIEAALTWAGEDETRRQSDVLAAFVALVRALDQYRKRASS